MTVPAGRINKLFGTDGGLMLSLYADFPADFDTDTPLLVTIDALEVPIWCERFERRGAAGAVATFADFDTERRAQELIGREFRIEFEEDEDDEFYPEDLIGFAVTGFETRHGDTPETQRSEENESSRHGGKGGENTHPAKGDKATQHNKVSVETQQVEGGETTPPGEGSVDSDGNNDNNGNCDGNNTTGNNGKPAAGQFTGTVTDYYDSDANPLFELEIGGRRVLVPAAEEFIAHIDFERRTMKLILPEGLTELNSSNLP